MIRKRRKQKEISTPKTEAEKRTYRKPSEQLFPNRRPLSYLNLTKTMKTYIRLENSTKNRLQNIKQIEPQQKYRR